MFCALWKLLEPFCPALVTTVWGQCPDGGEGACWHCRARFQDPCPGCFLCFPQDDAGLQYGAPFLSNQVSTAERDHSMCPPLGFPAGSSTVPPHPLKQKQWPCPQLVPLGQGQTCWFARAELKQGSLSKVPHCIFSWSSHLLSCRGAGRECHEDQAETSLLEEGRASSGMKTQPGCCLHRPSSAWWDSSTSQFSILTTPKL